MQFESVEHGYANLWAKAEIRPERGGAAKTIAQKLAGDRARYEAVSEKVGAPWWWVAIIHQMEADANFTKHLHNGDPLTARTVHVPAGRPPKPLMPPFAWEQSAADALTLEGIAAVKEWTVPRALYQFEKYNGFAYFNHAINSPYVWSFTTLYTRGKYVADGRFNAGAVSKQCGAAAILKAMAAAGIVNLQDLT
jgi:lysozyme family protein